MTSSRRGEPESEPAEVHLISGARRAHSDDLDRRMKRYLISMGIRTVCVVLAVIVDGPLRWLFVAGAVLLPYVAVVMANVVGEPRQTPIARPALSRTALPGSAEGPGRPAQIYIPEPQSSSMSAHVPAAGSSERVIRDPPGRKAD